jgi:hypothetical protein
VLPLLFSSLVAARATESLITMLFRKPVTGETTPDTASPNISEVETGDKASVTHAEKLSSQQTSAHLQWKLSRGGDGDTAFALFSNPDELHEELDPTQKRALQRKIDFMIFPTWQYALHSSILTRQR